MSLQIVTPNTEAAILARIIEADEQPLSVDVARYLLSMRLPVCDEERVNELAYRILTRHAGRGKRANHRQEQ